MQNRESFENLLGYNTNRASLGYKRALHHLLLDNNINLTVDELIVIMRLWVRDGLKQSEIASQMQKDKARVTRVLNSLIKKGYVRKRVQNIDKRNFIIYLTDAAIDLEHQMKPELIYLKNCLESDISKEDLELTRRVFRTMRANLEKM